MARNTSYIDGPALRKAVDTKLRNLSQGSGRSMVELRREFLYQRFLARLFHDPGAPWVIKGGVGLLTRLPCARHSRDIDLLHLVPDPSIAEAEIREAGRRDLGDHLTFEVTRSVPLSVAGALRLKMTVYVGATMWDRFDVDVSCEVHFVAEIETVTPKPIIEVAGTPELPAFQLYPLADQVADKVAAMYELHGTTGTPSGRFRDLVDLCLIIATCTLDAEVLAAALRTREKCTRSALTLPNAMHVPGPGWPEAFGALAEQVSLPADLRQIEDALAYVGRCLNPVLSNKITAGQWNPQIQEWDEPSKAAAPTSATA